MSKLLFNDPSDRWATTGIDRGVLYINGIGTVWAGLKSYEDRTVSPSLVQHYCEGRKYYTEVPPTNSAGKLEIYTYPDEFAPCLGIDQVGAWSSYNQARTRFSFSYRTEVVNATKLIGHKIHLVYNALVDGFEEKNSTRDASPELASIGFDLDLLPVDSGLAYPSAHYSFNTAKAGSDLTKAFEEIVYGGFESDARLPEPKEIRDLVSATGEDVFSIVFQK